MRRVVTTVTFKNGVLPEERITSLPVIKTFPARLPTNQGKVFPIMLAVAADAILTAFILVNSTRMVTLIFLDALKNLFVALNTFESSGSSSQAVTGSAFAQAVQAAVGFGQRSRRNLCPSRGSQPPNQQE